MGITTTEQIVKYSGRGGWRGGGRPKGSLDVKTRTLIDVKARIAAKADEIINAELMDGLGVNIVLKRTENGYTEVTDPSEIKEIVDTYKGASGEVNGEFYIISAKPGNYKSRQYLLDRAFGKPSQSVEIREDDTVRDMCERISGLIDEYGREQAMEIFRMFQAKSLADGVGEEVLRLVEGDNK